MIVVYFFQYTYSYIILVLNCSLVYICLSLSLFLAGDHHSGSSSISPPKIMGLVGVAIALPPPSVNELRLEPDMFVVRLGLDFKILHVEPR